MRGAMVSLLVEIVGGTQPMCEESNTHRGKITAHKVDQRGGRERLEIYSAVGLPCRVVEKYSRLSLRKK